MTNDTIRTLSSFFLAWLGSTIDNPNKAENRSQWLQAIDSFVISESRVNVHATYVALCQLVKDLEEAGDDTDRLEQITKQLHVYWTIGDGTATDFSKHYSEIAELLRRALEEKA